MKYLSVIIGLVVTLTFCSCVYKEIDTNLENAKKLRIGMTKTEVLEIMGKPLVNEIYNKPNCWYYVVSVNWHDGLYTRDECMPLVFKQGKLLGWGNEFLSRKNLVKDASFQSNQ